MLQNFINRHFEVLQSPCVDTCEQCPKPKLICPKCHKIPKTKPDYSADCYHYLPASETHKKINDKESEIDDFQPRVQLKKAKLEFENDIQNFCDMFIVEKDLELKYFNHLK